MNLHGIKLHGITPDQMQQVIESIMGPQLQVVHESPVTSAGAEMGLVVVAPTKTPQGQQPLQTLQDQVLHDYGTPAADPLGLVAIFPVLDSWRGPCPACWGSGTTLSLILHLNDWHRWSRDAIADWLETLDVDLTVQPAATGD